MATRQERQAAQAAKIAGMSLPKRIGMVLLGGLTAFAACVAMNYLLSAEPNLGLAIAVALGITLVMGYQYLVAPSRQ